jgi:uncharacterized membrane protein YfcA
MDGSATTYLLALPLAFTVGISLGLLGGGGSILTVPIFVYILRVSPKSAIASSLIVVGLTSLTGAARHAVLGHLRWKVGLIFGAAGIVGASVGSRVAALEMVPGSVLVAAFGALMITVASLLLRGGGRRGETVEEAPAPRRGALALTGLLTGGLPGLLGAGGGFIVVPSLLVVGRLSVHAAIGTSLLVIALNCASGLAGFVGAVPIRWKLAFAFAAVSVVGSLVGAHLAARTRPRRLRTAFAVFVLLAGTAILIERVARMAGA